ncbi:hypothetical protein [Lysinibacillus sphaericus]|uniref:hypothetical protein n=1 Tax=Lysinibacillus sphaericus TaxID=1421 RepID=UPI001A9D7F0E|nr:hypothetical protein [Lysinibacillus sphaericus]QTB26600.1 hypothetical protein J2D51_20700 [Lysinibacillus sphaericus]
MEKETRQEKFRRIAETRMSRIFSDLNLMANLSNKKHYEYSSQDVKEIFDALYNKGRDVRTYFEDYSSSRQPLSKSFSFSNKEGKIQEKETKEEKFRRIAETRISRIFVDMNLIANLSNKKHYKYSIQEVDELFTAYENKIREIQFYFEPLTQNFTFSN